MGLLAVDVAILPPPSVADVARAVSRALPASGSERLVLDDTHLPHITLTQQFVDCGDLAAVKGTIDRILAGDAPLELHITGPGRGARSVWMQVRPSDELRRLHTDLMAALAPFERHGGSAAAFVDAAGRPGDVRWVANYRTASAYGRFAPHITLGHASRLPHVEPITFAADAVALCHLGRFCSCRAVLASWTLTGSVLHQPGTDPRSA